MSETLPVDGSTGALKRPGRATGWRHHQFRPVLPFLLLALLFLWPYRSETLNPTNLRDVVVPTVEASRAIAEGQFPVRVAPLQLNGSRYPLFQFYGNLPFTACGALA